MRSETFHTPGGGTLVLRLPSGSVEIESVDGDETRVELEGLNDPGREAVERTTLEQDGENVRVELGEERSLILAFRSPKIRARISCPHGTRLRAKVVDADFVARGRFGPSDVKSVSGDVEVGEIDGDLELKAVSGDLTTQRVAGSVSVNTVSGNVAVAEIGGSATGKTISGDLELRSVREGQVSVQSVSGDVTVGVAPGAGVWMDLKSLSGDTRSELAAADGPAGEVSSTVEVRAKTVSGDIRIVRA